MHYLKYQKLSDYFKFIFKKNDNFNYFIFINIIYINNSLILNIINKII